MHNKKAAECSIYLSPILQILELGRIRNRNSSKLPPVDYVARSGRTKKTDKKKIARTSHNRKIHTVNPDKYNALLNDAYQKTTIARLSAIG